MSDAYDLVSSRVNAQAVDQAISEAFGSVTNVNAATQSAADAGSQIETATDRVVLAVNTSVMLLSSMNQMATNLITHPTMTLALGTPAVAP